MGGDNENLPLVIRPGNVQGDPQPGVGKFPSRTGQARRALSAINQNLIGVNERAVISEKNGISSVIPPVPAHRPITRKFAQQMSSNEGQPPLPKGTTKHEDLIIVDSESPMLDKIDQMEVEMEDASDSDENVRDIDNEHQNNHLNVAEYVDELYAYYKKVESLSCAASDYMSQQSNINDKMRAILIDWLIEVHYKFELMEETLYLTVNLIDRFLSVEQVARKKLQLVGVTAMLIACKYEEVTVPVVEDLVLISDNAYSREDVLDMEKLMLNKLQFNVSVPTPYVFMNRFLKAAESDKKTELLSFYIMELSLVEYEMVKFPPSLLAAAAVFAAHCAFVGHRCWTRTSQQCSSYSSDDLMECSMKMVSLHQKAPTAKLNGVYRKYSTSKYGYSTKFEPAHFLLEDNSF